MPLSFLSVFCEVSEEHSALFLNNCSFVQDYTGHTLDVSGIVTCGAQIGISRQCQRKSEFYELESYQSALAEL